VLTNEGLRRNQHEPAFDTPFVVLARVAIGHLEGVGAKIEEFWKAQWHQWVLPYIQSVRSLFQEHDLPPVVA
jgi:hypothetical protein